MFGNLRRVVTIFAALGGVAVMLAAMLSFVALRERRQPLPPPEVPVAASPAEVCLKAVERKVTAAAEPDVAAASRAVAIVCGEDAATADRYEARNDALRSIARRRGLPEKDVAALVAYLRSKDDAMRVERVAALKNDVMNLLRNQDPLPKGLAETLIAMFSGGKHPSAVLDYCIQHLGAMFDELDEKGRLRVRAVLAKAAKRTKLPYAGTALYSLAEDARATPSQAAELKRLTLALCRPGAHPAARMAAIQLAGQRGYVETLPLVRETLSGPHRDAILDIVCLGTLGLLGDTDDLQLASQFTNYDTRRTVAAKAAIKRIKERADAGDCF